MRDIIKCDIFHKSHDSYKRADNIREQQNFPNCSSVYLILIISLRLWWVWHPAAALSLLSQEVISLFSSKAHQWQTPPPWPELLPRWNCSFHMLNCSLFTAQPGISGAGSEQHFGLLQGKAELKAPVCAGWDFPDETIHHKIGLRTKMGRSWSSKIQTFLFQSKTWLSWNAHA